MLAPQCLQRINVHLVRANILNGNILILHSGHWKGCHQLAVCPLFIFISNEIIYPDFKTVNPDNYIFIRVRLVSEANSFQFVVILRL